MAILPIITAPDPRLKTISRPVERVDDDLRRLMDDMLETMYAAPGIGLAAIQVGVPKRVLVIDLSEEEGVRKPLYFVNPEIVDAAEEYSVYNEGCLSLPDQYAEVERPSEVTVRFLDYHGEPQEIHATGLLATCIQHEMDHLDGVLFVDHLSSLKRNMILRKLKKMQRLAETG
ncbi:MAG: peptide deformylase [Alphaproteobacteria bacterium]|nr:MAG: peptide deformylase [Alphaproteobacteria bacterium]